MVAKNTVETEYEKLQVENRLLKAQIAAYQASTDNRVADHNPMQVLLDNIPAYIYFKDQQRRFVHASRLFCDLFKCGLEDIIGKKDEDLFPDEVAKLTVADDAHVCW